MITVSTQAELDLALQNPNAEISITGAIGRLTANIFYGAPYIEVGGSVDLHITARDSSQPHITAWGSSQPHITAWESSQPHIEARGSSRPHIEAWGSSQPHIEAWGYVQLSVFGAVIAKVSAKCSVLIHGTKAKVKGGKQTRVVIRTPKDWCEYYGVKVVRGIATLYKALDADYKSPRAFAYLPGTTPAAPDWDGGKAECGGGLHFSPSPAMALEFYPGAVKFAACPVRLKDIAIHPDGDYPRKCKASGICKPIYEVDREGEAK
ncbi:MAG: hypothetical protein ABFD89_00715 [Bryobacteraceae bacterium]